MKFSALLLTGALVAPFSFAAPLQSSGAQAEARQHLLRLGIQFIQVSLELPV